MAIFKEDIIHKRRLNLAIAWESYLQEHDCVIVACGEPIQKPGGLDQVYPFLPHPSYFWLTGIRRPESVVLYSKKYGWIDFVKPVTKEESLWEGSTGGVNLHGQQDIDGLHSFLTKRNFEHVFILGQVSDKIRSFAKNNDLLFQTYLNHAIDSARVIADGLKQIKILKGNTDSILESGAISVVDKWKDFGRIRIEDDILITKSSPRVLTEAIQK